MSDARRLAATFAVLMLLATAAFAIGVSIEQSKSSGDTTSEVSHAGEGTESPQQAEAGHMGEGATGQSHPDESKRIAGVDLESTPLIILAVVVSAGFAGAALAWPRWSVFALAGVFCAAFALLDGGELAPQLHGHAGKFAAFAALALVLHLGAVAAAAFGTARARDVRTSAVFT